MTPKGQIIKGYKATDKNMCCRDFQFELGKWYECEGEIELCQNGFHFCEYPSGPWSYYDDCRIFKCEAEEVVKSVGSGSGLKHVCRRIRLVEERIFTGDQNTGRWNTGDQNTGRWNTGDQNTGHRNTGDRNTGDQNTGHRNTGDQNTGHRNTGDQNTGDQNTGRWNTGHRNTGDQNTGHGNTGRWNTGDQNTGRWNTGDQNTGHRNTGDQNTGDQNTGHGNVGNFHSGDLNCGESSYYLFDKPAKRKNADEYLILQLCQLLSKDDSIDPVPFLSLPNATVEAIEKLHKAHIEARKLRKK